MRATVDDADSFDFVSVVLDELLKITYQRLRSLSAGLVVACMHQRVGSELVNNLLAAPRQRL